MRPLALLLAVPAGIATAAGAWLMLGLRFRVPFFRDGIRRMNRAVMNPMQVRNGAGGPGSWASIVHHVGRTSGRAYATPVATVPTDDGFVVVLPYGPGADWVRNVLAAGTATIDDDGTTILVDRPEVVDVAVAAPWLSSSDLRTNRIFGIDHGLLLRRAT